MHRMLAAVCLVVTVTACGTTVPLSQQGSASQNGITGLTSGETPTGTSASDTPDPGAVPGEPGSAGSTGATVSDTSGSPSTTGALPGSTASVPALATSKARGVTASTIALGVAVATGEEALGKSLGISGAGTISVADMMNAVVADVNKRGGVLGRKLTLYVHSFDAAAGVANPAQTINEICTDFRDDHKVFAVLFDLGYPELRKCLAQMGSPWLLTNGVSSIVPAAAYSAYGGSYLYGPNAITTERLAKLFIDSLLARSFTEKWNTTAGGPGGIAPTKLGVIHVDTPDQNALYAAYAKELAKHGLKFDDTVTYTQDVSAALASTQNAVLKFRADGITHVFGASAFFLSDAESQGYRPRYAYLPGLGTIGVANAPAAQMNGALTVGWTPTSDVNATEDPGESPAGAQCRRVMKAAGLDTTSRTDRTDMYAACDAVYAFRAALTASQVATVPGLRRGYEALGSGFRTALTFNAVLGPNAHWGVSSVRDMAFDSACKCLRYTSRTNRS